MLFCNVMMHVPNEQAEIKLVHQEDKETEVIVPAGLCVVCFKSYEVSCFLVGVIVAHIASEDEIPKTDQQLLQPLKSAAPFSRVRSRVSHEAKQQIVPI